MSEIQFSISFLDFPSVFQYVLFVSATFPAVYQSSYWHFKTVPWGLILSALKSFFASKVSQVQSYSVTFPRLNRNRVRLVSGLSTIGSNQGREPALFFFIPYGI